jgi:hypothetical protein
VTLLLDTVTRAGERTNAETRRRNGAGSLFGENGNRETEERMKENLYKRLPPLERRPQKLMNNMKIQSARKATHTWLAGKIKCGNCGYALMSIFNPSGRQYLRCTKRLDNKSCPGCGKIITAELEAVVYQQMVKKLDSYKTLTGRKKAAKANPKITALQVELAHVDGEIEKLLDSLTGANNVLLSYVNVKIAELDGRKQELLARIAELTVEAISPEQVSQISGYLDTWDSVSFDDKRRVVDLMITTVAATSDSLNITWKI